MLFRQATAALVIGAILVTGAAAMTRDSAAAGELSGDLPSAGGVALVSWSGGSTSELVDDANAAGCELASIWSFATGFPVGYLVGAPDFVNDAHFALYPGGHVPEGPMLLVCAQPSTSAVVYRAAHFEVDVTRDIVYGQGLSHADWGSAQRSAVNLTLDLYRPSTASVAPRPAIVLIHGGGFRSGTSRNGAFVDAAQYFASRGWVAVSINYRLADDHGTVPSNWVSSQAAYPAIRDAKAAVRWLRANAATYHIDTERITAQGGSAGGIAALAVGASDEADYRDEISIEEDWTLATTNRQQSSRVATVVDHWGSLSAVNALRFFDGRSRIDSSDPPTIILHGTEDSVVPYAAGVEVRDAYEAASISVAFHPIPGAGHSPWNAQIDGRSQNSIVRDFIVKHQDLELR